MLVHASNPGTQAVEPGEKEAQGYLQLHSKYQASLGVREPLSVRERMANNVEKQTVF